MNGNWIKIALAVSLALNLFIVGAFVGATFQRERTVALRTAPVPGNPLMRAGDSLPPDQREAYRMRLRQAGMSNRPLLDANREARQKVAEAFSAATFDPAVAESALAAARQAEMDGRAKLETAVVEFAKGLNADERKALAQALNRPPGPGRGGGRGPHGPDGRGFGPGGPDAGPGGFGPQGPPQGPDGGPPDR